MATVTANETHEVGGIRMDRPFRVQRLGHFGFNVKDQERALHFYSDLLGLPVTDTRDFGRLAGEAKPGPEHLGWFLRVNNDHHSVVLFPDPARFTDPPPRKPGSAWISHMAWQVGTLDEVVEGRRWARECQLTLARPGGRDARGANWNVTLQDAEGISNELYYGMDQIGWDGVSKPEPICPNGDPLPEIGGAAEPDFPIARAAIEGGLDLRQGLHQRPFGTPAYDVGGVKLARPFRILRNGPIRIFAADVAESERFYTDVVGLAVTERIAWQGHDCVFLRANTEHHTIALYPLALREELGMRPDSVCMAYGMQVGSYRQLKDAIAFLKGHGVTIRYLPPELSPGIDYSAFALDPDGHAVQLYYYMEQIGWDGRPRPAALRRKVDNANWPDSLDALPDTFLGPVFQGPLG
jgi:catechol 2,3-dioxygenase-like lactoylglutathione lyase family enzyme